MGPRLEALGQRFGAPGPIVGALGSRFGAMRPRFGALGPKLGALGPFFRVLGSRLEVFGPSAHIASWHSAKSGRLIITSDVTRGINLTSEELVAPFLV